MGNFGDCSIVAFDRITPGAIDYLRDMQLNVISIDGLWELQFGNGVNLGKAKAFYFATGLRDGAGDLLAGLRSRRFRNLNPGRYLPPTSFLGSVTARHSTIKRMLPRSERRVG